MCNRNKPSGTVLGYNSDLEYFTRCLEIAEDMYNKMYLLMKQKALECMHTHR